MPKKVSEKEYTEVVEAVARFADGATLDDLDGALKSTIPRRTLQRRLSDLVAKERLVRTGKGKATRYARPRDEPTPDTTKDEPQAATSIVKLTDAAMAIRNVVRQPVAMRDPVGDNRAFLDDYRPNKTFYLSEDYRAKLSEAAGSPEEGLPPGTYAKTLMGRLLIDLSWNSSRLEGNTYSLLETERLIEMGESSEGKDIEEAQMILNHKSAIEMLIENVSEVGINAYTIRNLHALLSDNLLADPGACGRLRSISVGIAGSVFKPLDNPQLVEECFAQVLATADAIENAFEQSFFLLVHLPYLQPFEDVNKRVSRLAANIPLIQRNLCPLSFVDVPEEDYSLATLGVYELNRVEYLAEVFVWAYLRSCKRYSAVRQSLGEPDPFRLRYRDAISKVVSGIVKSKVGQKAAVAAIRDAAADIADSDRKRFTEVVEVELMQLHEGNIARYRLRPSEFQAWKAVWR